MANAFLLSFFLLLLVVTNICWGQDAQENEGVPDADQGNEGVPDAQENEGVPDEGDEGVPDTQEDEGAPAAAPEGVPDTQEDESAPAAAPCDAQENEGVPDDQENEDEGAPAAAPEGVPDTQEDESAPAAAPCDAQENEGVPDAQGDEGVSDTQEDEGVPAAAPEGVPDAQEDEGAPGAAPEAAPAASCLSDTDENIIYYNTGDSTEGSPFEENLASAYESLLATTDSNQVKVGEDPDSVYGYAGCFSGNCEECLSTCKNFFTKVAPLSLGARLCLKTDSYACYLRYENYSF